MVQTAPLLLALALGSPLTVADPRPATAVLDVTGTLSAAERAAIDDAARRVRASGRGELVVVVLRSVAPAEPRAFATQLFNRWRIGDATRDDGVLLFAALDDRAAELVLGAGVDGDEQVAASDAIMQEVMVPRFRAGQPGAAMLQGAWAAAERILGVPLGPLVAEDAEARDGDANTAGERAAPPAAPAAYDAPPDSSRGGGCLTLGGGFAAIVALLTGGRAWWRRRPRTCPTCRKRMVRLGEAEDDAHLSSGEKVEERLGSVDYDVWHCADCNQAIKVRWGAFTTRYGRCVQCGSVTKSSSTTTLQAATYTSGGLVRVDEHCAHCDHRSSSTRSTPMLQQSSSSSSSSRSSFRSSSSSSSSRSSFRSGGGSSGRGSSGRW
jgi:uncharacterized protein